MKQEEEEGKVRSGKRGHGKGSRVEGREAGKESLPLI